jgi:hypothetical protein
LLLLLLCGCKETRKSAKGVFSIAKMSEITPLESWKVPHATSGAITDSTISNNINNNSNMMDIESTSKQQTSRKDKTKKKKKKKKMLISNQPTSFQTEESNTNTKTSHKRKFEEVETPHS